MGGRGCINNRHSAASAHLASGRASPSPALPPCLHTFLPCLPQISAGQMHSAAISADGDAFMWGYGKFNQLGVCRAVTLQRRRL